MSVESLKSYLHLRIDKADELLLNKIAAIIDESVSDSEQHDTDNDLLTPAQKQELERRYQEYLSGNTESYSFEEVKMYLRTRKTS
ncbi:MAG: addiction module protein [Bacteroidetes bacterium]|nr:addiction module protein [Bacteroidota bacterium]